MRRLAAGRRPVALSRHGLDHFLAGHRLALLGQNLRRRVQATQLAVLALGGGLLTFCLSFCLRLVLAAFAHDSPPVSMDAAIFRPGPVRASTEDSYLAMRRVIKAIPAG